MDICKDDCKTNLQYYRKKKWLTQAELAQLADVNLRTLQDYEQGRKSINGARTETVTRLAQVLGCKVNDLME